MTFRYILTGEIWTSKDRINGRRYSLSILSKCTDEELAAFGLERIPVPEPDITPPPPRLEGSFREFMDLFDATEQQAVAGAAMSNVTVKLWYDRAMGGSIRLDHADTAAGLAALVDAQIIDQAAADRVLAASYPEII